MELWNIIRSRVGQFDWRRHAPVAGSIAAHGVVGVAVAAVMAASVKPEIMRAESPPLEVALIVDSLPAPSDMRPPAPRPAPRPSAEPSGDTAPAIAGPARKTDKPATSQPAVTPDSDTVYIPPSPFAQQGPTGGLAGLVALDPCTALKGTKPKDCAKNWSGSIGTEPSVMPRTEKDLRTYHAEFMATCGLRTGCGPNSGVAPGGVLNNGARSFGLTSPMASGAGGVQGINELVGRLPQKPDYVDPGFGD